MLGDASQTLNNSVAQDKNWKLTIDWAAVLRILEADETIVGQPLSGLIAAYGRR